jgi:hypothetical protein
MIMSTNEIVYLIGVVAAFAAFCGTLAWGASYTHKKQH